MAQSYRLRLIFTVRMVDELYMRRCFELAMRGSGNVAPNPMVGAVLVHGNRITGEGWHARYGQAHAEVMCLDNVALEDRLLLPQSTMYVSLEPCAHTGKTPPCAIRLVKEQVAEVIIANRDPFEKVDGAGINILHGAGIKTSAGLLAQDGGWLNRRFFTFHEMKRPYIILKWAQSADGYIAPADKLRTQLSNLYSNALVHRWRTEETAIMVGYQTALHDNPQLTSRQWQGTQPLRIVTDRHMRLPTAHHLYNTDAPTWILNELQESAAGNVHFIRMDFGQSVLPQLMNRLYHASRISLIVEGGGALLRSFIDAGLWDEARVFSTPVVLGTGISAPQLVNAARAMDMEVSDDTLQLWVNKDSRHPYVPGMSL